MTASQSGEDQGGQSGELSEHVSNTMISMERARMEIPYCTLFEKGEVDKAGPFGDVILWYPPQKNCGNTTTDHSKESQAASGLERHGHVN